MNKAEKYKKVKRTLIVILIIMVVFSFVAVVNLTSRLEDIIMAQNILIERVSNNF